MTTADSPSKGFRHQVGRPFRALGRGIARVVEALDLLSLIVHIVRGVVWLFRSVGRAISGWF
ncbi:hypothetical protein J2S48_004359 [Promicromonospora iranensis]|uniref:Uncharacterized protein n=1 Tax=Promicromonospora iranensis TaxID=1105144 RepID=A0ABU2CU24_9MICO|nr:hypothetical protein [Promicromonospora iranensis]